MVKNEEYKKECRQCEYAEETPEHYAVYDTEIICHRYPPVAIERGGPIFLFVQKNEWCGEFVRSIEKRD